MNRRAYFAPATVEEALDIVREHSREGVVAGGTDAVVDHRSGKRALPNAVVSIHRLDELKGLQVEADGSMRFGALVTHADLAHSSSVSAQLTALADASAIVGSPATRAAGTLGGNLVNASPAMDTASPLLVLGATGELESHAGRRDVPMADMWTGPGRSVLDEAELLTAVRVPGPAPRTGSAYVRLDYRRAMEIAVVGAASAITLSDDGVVTAASVALTAVGPTCFVAGNVGRVLVGHRPEDTIIEAAGSAAADAAMPITDSRASARYRSHMVGVIVARAILIAAVRASGGAVGVPASHHWRSIETGTEVAS